MAEPVLAVLAPVYPLISGASQFNTAMVAALRRQGEVRVISWKQLYPQFLHQHSSLDMISKPTMVQPAECLLEWNNPRSWRAALHRITDAQAMILPWLHPVMTPSYRYLLKHAPADMTRVVICHNVLPHQHVIGQSLLTKAVLKHADVLVTHATHQQGELSQLGFAQTPCLSAFHPLFVPEDLCSLPSVKLVEAERARQGNPELSLLVFGAIRPYKGLDLGLEALARVKNTLHLKLIVAGVFWNGVAQWQERVNALGLQEHVQLIDGYQTHEQAALLFSAADASLLPYRSASQSGVVALSFAYNCPVIATDVGGLSEAVEHNHNGILCPPADVEALAQAITEMAGNKQYFADGVQKSKQLRSFAHYGDCLHTAIKNVRLRG